MWCIVNNNSQTPAAIHLREHPTVIGVSHDGINTNYSRIPDEGIDLGNPTYLDVSYETDEELVLAAGSFLAQGTDELLIGTKSQFCTLYATPQWKLWCGQYENKDQLELDHETVFDVGVDKRKALSTLVEETRAELLALFTS